MVAPVSSLSSVTERQSFEIGLISVAKFVAPADFEHGMVRASRNESKVFSRRFPRLLSYALIIIWMVHCLVSWGVLPSISGMRLCNSVNFVRKLPTRAAYYLLTGSREPSSPSNPEISAPNSPEASALCNNNPAPSTGALSLVSGGVLWTGTSFILFVGYGLT